MEIVSIQHKCYQPEYDPDKDEYFDKSPIKKFERNNIHFTCKCRINSQFRTLSEYKIHINTKTHINFIKNYKIYNKELTDANRRIVELTKDYELVSRKNIELINENEILLRKNIEIKEENIELTKAVKNYRDIYVIPELDNLCE